MGDMSKQVEKTTTGGRGLGQRRIPNWIRRRRAERNRDQARLQAIENQLAVMRIAAGHTTRQHAQAGSCRDVFANLTIHEEPDEWR